MMLFSRDGVWIFGDRFCIANGFFNTCFGIISTLTMTLISFDRYYAIARQPQEKNREEEGHSVVSGCLVNGVFSPCLGIWCWEHLMIWWCIKGDFIIACMSFIQVHPEWAQLTA
uniref:G-protein coupled receptors family 1 profile domain-containing protein n=1 Tax=Anguilla anguilla TaxID=7936 RepID=A0A0E9WPU0_ANGAN